MSNLSLIITFMEQRKLSLEEIQALHANAEKERAKHAEIMKNFKAVTLSPQLQMTILMSSYERGRKDEIKALLEFHMSGNRQYELSSEVMMFIYEHGDELSEEKDFMLKNNHLGYEVSKRIFDDKLPPFITTPQGETVYPKFCPYAEVYMVEETLKACQKADKLSDELKFLTDYTHGYVLADVAEVALTNFLFVSSACDDVIKCLRSFVLDYLVCHRHIADDALLRIIKAGDHEIILYYITHSTLIISDSKVLNALKERADAEEITAYYNRWAREK